MARIGHLFEADSTHSGLKEYDPSTVSGRTKTPVSIFVQLTMNGNPRATAYRQPIKSVNLVRLATTTKPTLEAGHMPISVLDRKNQESCCSTCYRILGDRLQNDR